MITAVLYDDTRKFDWLCLTPGDYNSASFPVDRIPVPPQTILTGMYFSRFHMTRLGNPGLQVPRRLAKNLADRRDAIGGFPRLHYLIAPQQLTCHEIRRITRANLI